MSSRKLSFAFLWRLSAVLLGLSVLAGCGGSGGGGGTTTPTSPTVSLSATSLTFSRQAIGTTSSGQSVVVSNSGTATLTITGISISGDFSQTNSGCTSVSAGASTCAITVTFKPTAGGTRTGTLTITDNASGSPHTVALSGAGSSVALSATSLSFSGVAVGASSSPMPVTLSNVGSTALAISSIATTGDFSQTNSCGSGVAAGGSCTINVTFSPTATGTRTGTLTITDNDGGTAGSTQTVSLTGTTSLANVADVSVSFGPGGQSGGYYNGIFTTVTVCQPGTSTCVSIPDVLVDTGSVGLRVLSDQLGSVSLTPISDGANTTLYECVQYGDLSYTWGPMAMASVQVGGETATQIPGGTANAGIPIQVITANGAAPSGAACAQGGGQSDNSVAILGARGILGVGNFKQDCGDYCTTAPSSYASPPWPYIACTTSSCSYATVPLSSQAWNPVSAFSSTDTNGVILTLPSIPAAGQATAAGTLIFGVGTESNNAIPTGATAYGLDNYGNFASTVFNNVTYTSASFVDSGSNALYVSDPTTLTSVTGITTVTCADNGYYCPSSTLTLNLTNTGSNGASGPVTLSIANADSLLAANPGNAALSNLGGASGTDPSSDYFDYGLPFFFGRSVVVGIEGTSVGSTTFANGYWAF